MRILVAEDDFTTRSMLQAVLAKWGHKVIGTSDGEEAWAVLQGGDPPQLALLDWEMPGMNGLALCRKVKDMDRATPIYVILLTGREAKEDVVQGLDAGADDYITKPFDNSELRARLQAAERMIAVQSALATKIEELRMALDHVKVLQGIIPICMHCHRIRNDNQAWDRIESYIANHSDAQFSHSICPECVEEHYPDFMDEEGDA